MREEGIRLRRRVGWVCVLALAAVCSAVVSAGAARAQGDPAIRVGDRTSHGGFVQGGSPNVVIGGVIAARVGHPVSCALTCGPTVPHGGGPITTGSTTVFINGQPAARQGSTATEACATSTLVGGTSSVLIGP